MLTNLAVGSAAIDSRAALVDRLRLRKENEIKV